MRRGVKSQLSNALAERFGVDAKTIRDIWNRKSWKEEEEAAAASSLSSFALLNAQQQQNSLSSFALGEDDVMIADSFFCNVE